jgi:hypothetical protein
MVELPAARKEPPDQQLNRVFVRARRIAAASRLGSQMSIVANRPTRLLSQFAGASRFLGTSYAVFPFKPNPGLNGAPIGYFMNQGKADPSTSLRMTTVEFSACFGQADGFLK